MNNILKLTFATVIKTNEDHIRYSPVIQYKYFLLR